MIPFGLGPSLTERRGRIREPSAVMGRVLRTWGAKRLRVRDCCGSVYDATSPGYGRMDRSWGQRESSVLVVGC